MSADPGGSGITDSATEMAVAKLQYKPQVEESRSKAMAHQKREREGNNNIEFRLSLTVAVSPTDAPTTVAITTPEVMKLAVESPSVKNSAAVPVTPEKVSGGVNDRPLKKAAVESHPVRVPAPSVNKLAVEMLTMKKPAPAISLAPSTAQRALPDLSVAITPRVLNPASVESSAAAESVEKVKEPAPPSPNPWHIKIDSNAARMEKKKSSHSLVALSLGCEDKQLFQHIVETFSFPNQDYLKNLSPALNKMLKNHFKQQQPPCPDCGSSKFVRFRYFNNFKRAILLQPRYTCRNPVHNDGKQQQVSGCNDVTTSMPLKPGNVCVLSRYTCGRRPRHEEWTLLPPKKSYQQGQGPTLGQGPGVAKGTGVPTKPSTVTLSPAISSSSSKEDEDDRTADVAMRLTAKPSSTCGAAALSTSPCPEEWPHIMQGPNVVNPAPTSLRSNSTEDKRSRVADVETSRLLKPSGTSATSCPSKWPCYKDWPSNRQKGQGPSEGGFLAIANPGPVSLSSNSHQILNYQDRGVDQGPSEDGVPLTIAIPDPTSSSSNSHQPSNCQNQGPGQGLSGGVDVSPKPTIVSPHLVSSCSNSKVDDCNKKNATSTTTRGKPQYIRVRSYVYDHTPMS